MGGGTHQATIARISQPGELGSGWNGHRAAPISKESQVAAIALLHLVSMEFGLSVAEPTIVAPTPDGGVALEWIVKDRDERGVEVVCFPAWYEFTVRNRRTGKIEDDAEHVSRDNVLLNAIKPYVVGRLVLPG